MVPVTRRKLFSTLTHNLDGSVSQVEVRVAYKQVDDLAPNRDPLHDERWIKLGPDDMTTRDKIQLTEIANQIEAMIERKDPLVEP